MLKITEYADRLIDDLDGLDHIERVKTQQKNWIGRSYGMEVYFNIKGKDKVLKVYTTRPDTLYGVTYIVLAPEHPMVEELKDHIKNYDELLKYRNDASLKSDMERTELFKGKTGVRIEGMEAINPVTMELIPIFISDYVLITYGTGAIMAVPAHDTRDYEFAKIFKLPIIKVVEGGDVEKEAYTDNEDGVMVNSPLIDGLNVPEAKEKISDYLEKLGIGKRTKNFKLRDWVFSRQRYWGEPIPLVYCESCGWIPMDEKDLPLELPKVESYEPMDNGESPLARIFEFVNTTCPKCGKKAVRETDTMPQWAGSSWYFLRYVDPKNEKALASKKYLDYFMPVDWYNGGMEHTTLHLLYSRFWHKFLYDIGVVATNEPYMKRTSHGMILGENGEKMSKSRGNVVNPDEIVEEFGGDSLRMYEMFIGDFEKSIPWSKNGVKGCRRFLDKVYKLPEIIVDNEDYSKDLESTIHKTIKKVSYNYDNLKYNTAISTLMELVNSFNNKGEVTRGELKTLLILLNPVAPHITEELWVEVGYTGMLNQDIWPLYNEDKTIENIIEMPVQINGKLKGTIKISRTAFMEEAKEKALVEGSIARSLARKSILKEIYVPGKILNLIVK